jgi:HlyD family secretion protein
LAKAETLHELQEVNNPVEVEIAKARQGMADARLQRSELDHEKLLTIQPEARPPLEVAFSQAALDEATANAKLSAEEVKAAENKKLSVQSAAEDVKLAQEAVTTARTALADAEERFRETKIVSPIDGMITTINVQNGMIIQSGTTSFTGGTVLMTIADFSKLYVIAEVDEADIGTVRELAPERARPGANLLAGDSGLNAGGNGVEHRIEEGRPVKISAEAFRDESFEGVIDRILPEPQTRQAIISYDVRILLTSENRNKLFLGMQADVEFTAESIEDALLIPQDAIRIGPDGSHGVFIPVPSRDDPEEKEPKFVPVKLGVTDGFSTEILKGDIKAGDEVYTIIPRNYNTGEEKGEDDEDDE